MIDKLLYAVVVFGAAYFAVNMTTKPIEYRVVYERKSCWPSLNDYSWRVQQKINYRIVESWESLGYCSSTKSGAEKKLLAHIENEKLSTESKS